MGNPEYDADMAGTETRPEPISLDDHIAGIGETDADDVDVGRGITLCFETFGSPRDPTVLLIMGLGAQMIEWHRGFCTMLAARGLHVVRFDNRDAGLSTHIDEPVDLIEILQTIAGGSVPQVPYLLGDMAEDAVGLLDHLGVGQAHVVGVSLGGMIAQEMAIHHPDRVASLVLMMTRSGDMDVGMPSPAALQALMEPPAASKERTIQRGIENSQIWGSDAVPVEAIAAMGAAKWDRAPGPNGSPRQLAAMLASGSRSAGLRELSVPTLVIHGKKDQLIQPDGGEQLAELIPGAELMLVEGMGHDLARWLWPQLVPAIADHVDAQSTS